MSSAREALFALSHIHCQLCLICGKTGNTAVNDNQCFPVFINSLFFLLNPLSVSCRKMNTDVNASVITVDEIEVIKNDFDRTEGTIDSFTGTLRYVVVIPEQQVEEAPSTGCSAVVDNICLPIMKAKHGMAGRTLTMTSYY
ncbi:hypothetical protein T05_10655 [Trichinella murrelli]|uniref:Uncharacterized protein n=1 Tax=Trichinella murrelli TaxID=144512 RepID=A0A0V0TLW2_9BILA|nr:hypothetical protein T05_10655 [Trichinella murrelli]